MEFKDKVKKVTQKVGDVTEKAYKSVADTSSKILEGAKLKIKVNDIESEISEIYNQLGETLYEKYKAGESVGELAKECKRIEKLYKDISNIDEKALYMKNLRICEECQDTIGLENKFCPTCGAKQNKVKIHEIEEKKEEVQKVCPECGTVHGLDVNYCTKCGYKF